MKKLTLIAAMFLGMTLFAVNEVNAQCGCCGGKEKASVEQKCDKADCDCGCKEGKKCTCEKKAEKKGCCSEKKGCCGEKKSCCKDKKCCDKADCDCGCKDGKECTCEKKAEKKGCGCCKGE